MWIRQSFWSSAMFGNITLNAIKGLFLMVWYCELSTWYETSNQTEIGPEFEIKEKYLKDISGASFSIIPKVFR